MTRQAPHNYRCFITGIEVVKPEHNRLVSRISFRADHAYGIDLHGSYEVRDGSGYAVGQVLTITITPGDI